MANLLKKLGLKRVLFVSLALNLVLLVLASLFVVRRFHQTAIYYTLFQSLWVPNLDNDFPASLARCHSRSVTPGADVVFLGDSLTNFADWKGLFPGVSLANAGIEGDVTDCVLYRLGIVLRTPPKKLFLLVGINDLILGKAPIRVAANYGRLVSAIRTSAPETKLFVQSVLPVRKVPGSPVEDRLVKELNDWIRKIAVSQEATYVDLFPALAASDGQLDAALTTDGVHLNAAGYERWKAVLLPLLTSQ